MRIYSNNPLGDIPLDKIILGVLIIVVVGFIVLALQTSVNTTLSAKLTKNPISLGKEESSVLHVVLTNPSSSPQSNVKVTTQTLGTTQLGVYPSAQTIPTLGPQETRELDFLIVPIDAPSNPFIPGNYRLDVEASVEGKKYPVSVFVTVTK
jgi:hypothetical protein